MGIVPLYKIRGVGEVIEAKLRNLGINSAEDLLNKLPRQFLDLSMSVPLEDARDGSFCLFDGIITGKSAPRKKGKLSIFTAECLCGEREVKLVWFNHAFVGKQLNIGETYTFFGKMKSHDFKCEFVNPHFEKKGENTRFTGVCPIYATKGSIGQSVYRKLVIDALNYCPESLISAETEQELQLMDLKKAYKCVHQPTKKENGEAVRRIAIELLTERIAAFRLAKKNSVKIKKNRYEKQLDFDTVTVNLPYKLTDSQNEALERITALMKNDERMNAVLCGDVGSGKTVVAAMAVFFAVKSGYQAALAAPTELLAAQHNEFFHGFFKNTGIRIGFLTGSTPISEKKKIYAAAANGEVDIVIGTHAVFSEKLRFQKLALVVADEQHRFGVAQRNSLVEKGENSDILTLSATPIPRTMCLAAYGEAEFITIRRRTYGNIKTSLVPSYKRADMFRYLAERCTDGAQAYVVAPKISDAEGIEKESCEELFKELTRYIPTEKIGLLHGKMPNEKKIAVMEAFRRGEISVLTATTVVEVGVDVPNASIIIIADADCFGLATLHQLRGRVGRNGEQGYCFLCSDSECERLHILTSETDGFKIAEEDFALRGGGEIFGLEQAGGGSLKYVNAKTLKIAKTAAERVDLERLKNRLAPLAEEFSLSKVTLG